MNHWRKSDIPMLLEGAEELREFTVSFRFLELDRQQCCILPKGRNIISYMPYDSLRKFSADLLYELKADHLAIICQELDGKVNVIVKNDLKKRDVVVYTINDPKKSKEYVHKVLSSHKIERYGLFIEQTGNLLRIADPRSDL